MPGPNMIIACPHCGHLAKKKTYFSWNTIGAVLWSDGKQVAPMKPEIPAFVFCKKCEKLYWIKETKEICEERNLSAFYPEQKDVDFIEFPTFEQYVNAFELIDDKKYARVHIFYSFNDFIRNNKENLITPEIQKLHEQNLYELSELFDEQDENELIMKAEAFRNLGLFEKSESMLNKISNPKLSKVKEKFLDEIRKRNKKLFKLFGR